MEKTMIKMLFLYFVLVISISSIMTQFGDNEDLLEDDNEEPSNETYHCIWYGHVNGTQKPKYYTGPPKKLQFGQIDLMHQFCHELAPDNSAKVCCDIAQVATINAELMAYQGLFNRCPSCFENWRVFYCNYNCSPEQSRFIVVKNATYIPEDGVDVEAEYYDYEEEYYE